MLEMIFKKSQQVQPSLLPGCGAFLAAVWEKVCFHSDFDLLLLVHDCLFTDMHMAICFGMVTLDCNHLKVKQGHVVNSFITKPQ